MRAGTKKCWVPAFGVAGLINTEKCSRTILLPMAVYRDPEGLRPDHEISLLHGAILCALPRSTRISVA